MIQKNIEGELPQMEDIFQVDKSLQPSQDGFVVASLDKVLKIDFQSIAEGDQMMTEALNKIESIWPRELLEALFSVLEELAQEYDFDFHHFGFLHPSRAAFDEATTGYTGDLVENKLVDPAGHEHYRKYIRVKTGDKDVFLEHALMGKNGDGRLSVHFDLVHEDAEKMLEIVREKLSVVAESIPGSTVFDSYFGGGNAPVGRIGIRFDNNETIDVGVMFRTHYSNPVDWN